MPDASPGPMHPGPTRTRVDDVRVGGRYRLLEILGRGGMATVHRARDEVLDRDVAVKLLHAHLARDPAFLERFRREARSAAALAHPNVVGVHDWGETDAGPFLVMQFVDGPSLREVLRQRRRLQPAEAVAVLVPAATGLGAAHDAGLVHRDVKPENLLLGLDGTVRVTDFGLARAAASATSTFGDDVLVGSPHYLSPEAVRGEPLDPRADVYALGVVLSELLTGRPPFEGESPFATAVQHTSRRVPPPSSRAPHVPASLDEIVACATEPDRDERYPDATAFASVLRDAVTDAGATVPGVLAGLDVTDGPVAATDARPVGAPGGTEVIDLAGAETTVAGAGGPAWLLGAPEEANAAVDDLPEVADADAHLDDDEDEDEGADTTPGTRRRRRWPIVLLLLVGLIGASALGGYLLWDRVLAPVIAIPAVDGAPEAQAVGALETAGFVVRIDRDRPHSLDVEEGHVISQEPVGEARTGSTVTLVLSAGPRQVEIADVEGEPVDEATAQLTEDGLVVDTTEEYDESVPAGVVIASEPEAGEVVDEATEVLLTVSLGRRPIEVPELRDATLDDARAILGDLGLESEITQRPYHDTAPEGTILGQNPAPGETLFRGDTVDLAVSRGPEPIEVPSVRGDQRDDAIETLEDLGFEVDVRESEGIRRFLTPGRVYDQDPAPGATRFPGDTITIFAYAD